MPLFEGGSLTDFRAWVQQRLRYPAEALEAGVQGRVVVQFIVERDGSLSSVKSVAAPAEVLAREAERVVGLSSGRWTAGRQHGEAVRVSYTLPVDFRCSEPATEAQPETIVVRGKVVGTDSEPLAGALVVRRGTTAGTVTDREGNFSIEAPKGTILDVSLVGRISVGVEAQSDLTVVLTFGGATTAEEVAVVGFGS